MNLTVHILPAEQAAQLQPFILPEVWEDAERKRFIYFAAADEEKLIGAAVVEPLKEEAKLRSIAVSPDYYRQGIASILLEQIMRTMASAKRDSLWAEYVFPDEEWEELEGLLQANGFAMIDEDPVYLASLAELMKSPLLKASYISEHLVSLAEASSLDLHHLNYALQEQMKIDASVLQECDPAYSFIWRQADVVTAAIFISPLKEGKADVLWMWLDAQAHNPKALMAVIGAAAQKCAATYPEETKLQFTCLTENSEQMLQHFVAGLKPMLSVRTYLACTAGVY